MKTASPSLSWNFHLLIKCGFNLLCLCCSLAQLFLACRKILVRPCGWKVFYFIQVRSQTAHTQIFRLVFFFLIQITSLYIIQMLILQHKIDNPVLYIYKTSISLHCMDQYNIDVHIMLIPQRKLDHPKHYIQQTSIQVHFID